MKATLKKSLSMIMVFMMIIFTMVILPPTAIAAASASTSLTDLGQGTQEDPYVINSPEDLLFLSTVEIQGQRGNKTVYMELANDIDMTGVEGFLSIVMKKDNSLVFDGQNHVIKNLTVEDGYATSDSCWVGGLFGLLRGGDVIENLHMENVTVKSGQGTNNVVAGGIVGQASSPFSMDNCSVTGTSTVTVSTDALRDQHVGGLVGYISADHDDPQEVIIRRCLNEATVIQDSASTYTVNMGGIVGKIELASHYDIRFCINNGAVVSQATSLSAGAQNISIGGILGRAERISSANAEIPYPQSFAYCFNTGDLAIAEARGSNSIGGILGEGRHFGEKNTGPELSMYRCFDYSKRVFHATTNGSNAALVGRTNSVDKEKVFFASYAMNKEGSTDPYEYLFHDDDGWANDLAWIENADIVTSLDVKLPLEENVSMTMEEAMREIEKVLECANGHVFNDACDADCNNGCGYVRPESELHEYTNACDPTCNGCGQVRDASHVYDNDCDTTCNRCYGTRTVEGHVYTDACDTSCNECGNIRTVEVHVYTDVCDTSCNECGDIRTVGNHVYTDACDTSCNECGNIRTVGDHVYTDACDPSCNECGNIRTVGAHVYTDACDPSCNECGDIRTVGGHVYADACDTTCNECGASRTAPHEYDNTCDRSCNLCGASRALGEHVYTDACDMDCNECGATRTVSHIYDNTCGAARIPSDHVYDHACDATCNICGAARVPSDHVYDNDEDLTCNTCGATRTVVTKTRETMTTPEEPTTATSLKKEESRSAINGIYVVLPLVGVVTLVTVLGYILMVKKRAKN